MKTREREQNLGGESRQWELVCKRERQRDRDRAGREGEHYIQ